MARTGSVPGRARIVTRYIFDEGWSRADSDGSGGICSRVSVGSGMGYFIIVKSASDEMSRFIERKDPGRRRRERIPKLQHPPVAPKLQLRNRLPDAGD